ncbi:helix-turn-helix transcriptional regulator [Cognatishimia sp. SS12]|uniref:helix-turn-helix transcriptional regulator n=1 Tax=Cognatishimia sp. SS12 TaxID=2979465 RepID=UPI00232B6700|nr:helix-turn-helix transcriptional regulator [Cognatishimia sp. SS12]MDC0737481.1 helix-turn-helix transcriptional regulator [Cognatishimia sp. SS12]
MQQSFAETLKSWRGVRHRSQLDLALSTGVSARHISFLETGRARPSRAMVLRLCEDLNVPRGARNQMLAAVGLAPAYEARALSAAELAPLKEAVDWMLTRHAPYPAIALDRHWGLVAMNPVAALMFGAVGIKEGDSLIEAVLHNIALRAAIVNVAEVEALALARLRTELAHFGRDAVLEAAIAALQSRVAGTEAAPALGALPAMMPAVYQLADQQLSLFSTISQFGATEDIAMADLRIELFFPADEATRVALTALEP